MLTLMTEGESFGETVLYHERAKRTATIITRSYCQLFMLSKNAVSTALATSPEAHRKLRERARDLYREHMADSGATAVISSQIFGTIDGTTRKSSFGGHPGMAIESENIRRSVDTISVAKLTEELGAIKMLLMGLTQDPDERSAFDDGSLHEDEEFLAPDDESPVGRQPQRTRSIIKQNSARLARSTSKKQVFFE